jgi:hypothetical protein
MSTQVSKSLVRFGALTILVIVSVVGATNVVGGMEAGPSMASALTFFAGFDGQMDAQFAKGNPRLFTASTEARKDAKAGNHRGDVEVLAGAGRHGDALQFRKKTPVTLFFEGDKNVAYRSADWSGTVSFWLKLDPDRDLQPGYCDPIQLTDKQWDDACIFVDFTKDERPRHFRLGVFADRKVWNPKNVKWDDIPDTDRPFCPPITKPPFTREAWTHVAVTFEKFNTGKADGLSILYLDGREAGRITGRTQTFTWNPERSAMLLGLNYIGLFDELACFDRALTPEEVLELHRLPKGVGSLVNK